METQWNHGFYILFYFHDLQLRPSAWESADTSFLKVFRASLKEQEWSNGAPINKGQTLIVDVQRDGSIAVSIVRSIFSFAHSPLRLLYFQRETALK
jgi:hypothetical protein